MLLISKTLFPIPRSDEEIWEGTYTLVVAFVLAFLVYSDYLSNLSPFGEILSSPCISTWIFVGKRMDRPRTPPPSYSEVLMMDVMYGQVSPHASNVECLPPPQSSRSAWNLWNKRRKTFAFLVLTGLAIAMILFIAFVIYVFNVNRRKKWITCLRSICWPDVERKHERWKISIV